MRKLTNIWVWLSTILWAVTGWAASTDCEQVDSTDGPTGAELVGPSEAAQQTRRPRGGEVERQPDGGRYEGEWKDGRRHGQGTVEFADGGRYEGEWRGGVEHGQGTRDYPNGHRYEGAWVDGSRDGAGVYYYDGHRYEGSWKDGVPHGQGAVYNANTTRFEGEWKEGNRHGRGTFYFTDGDRYIGEFAGREPFTSLLAVAMKASGNTGCRTVGASCISPTASATKDSGRTAKRTDWDYSTASAVT